MQTEFDFTLPKGYIDGDGVLHRTGTMRLATARDEIEPLRDPRVSGPDDPYLTILVIARVISGLGSIRQISPRDVEGFFAADLAFLQDLYGIINFGDPADVAALQQAVLPTQADDDADDTAPHGMTPDGIAPQDGVEVSGDDGAHEFAFDPQNFAREARDESVSPRRHGRIEEVVSRAGQ